MRRPRSTSAARSLKSDGRETGERTPGLTGVARHLDARLLLPANDPSPRIERPHEVSVEASPGSRPPLKKPSLWPRDCGQSGMTWTRLDAARHRDVLWPVDGRYLPIAEHGMIGDLHTVAPVEFAGHLVCHRDAPRRSFRLWAAELAEHVVRGRVRAARSNRHHANAAPAFAQAQADHRRRAIQRPADRLELSRPGVCDERVDLIKRRNRIRWQLTPRAASHRSFAAAGLA